MKKVILLLMSMLLLILSLMPMIVLADDGLNNGSVVFVIDDTKSMQTNDKEKLTVVSVQKYIDKLNDGEKIGNNVGVVTFSKTILKTQNITNVDSKENKDDVKNWVKENVEQEGSYTNCVVGIKQAVSMIEKDNNSNKAIVLVTDGEYDFDEKDGSVKSQLSSANSSLQEQLDKAKEQNIKIYTIKIEGEGVANDGNVDFDNITKLTNAKKYNAKNAEEIDKDIEDIQKDFLNLNLNNSEVELKKGKVSELQFDIPNGVIYAVIQIDHSADIEIKDFTYSNGDHVDYTESEGTGYLNVRISKPKSGRVTLFLYSTADQKSRISFVFASKMSINAELAKLSVNNKENIAVTANVYNEGKLYDNSDNSITVEAVLKDETGKEYNSYPMVQIDSTKEFVNNSAIVEDPGTYTVNVIVSGTDVSSEDMILTVEKAPLSPITWILIVLGILLLIAIIVVVVIIILKKRGKAPVPFGRFQIIEYSNYLNGDNAAGLIWQLERHPRINKKAKTLTVFDLMNKPDLVELQQVVFSAVIGQNGQPVLNITNNSPACQVSVDGIPVTNVPTQINRGGNLMVEIADKQVRINANRI